MTIVLVILAVLILLAVLFLIFHVSQLSKAHRELMTDYHTLLTDRVLDVQNIIAKQVNTIITAVNDARTDVVRLANKVDEGLTHCGNKTKDLKDTIVNLDSHLETRLTAPIDKINDTHNRIKTLGKGCVASDELREIVAQVTNAAVTHGVDQVRTILEDQAKTKTASKTKKTAKTPVTEVKA